MRRAAPLLALVAALAACGGGRATHTVLVQHYANFPSDTLTVSDFSPSSAACRRDASAFARESATFVAAHHTTVNIADATYFVMRETLADFDARRCGPALVGRALAAGLSPAWRRQLLADTPRGMAATIRGALSAAGF